MSTVRLGDVAAIVGGVGFPLAEQGSQGGTPFLKVSDLVNGSVTMSAAHTADAEALRRMGARVVPAGTVVLPKVGGALLTNKRTILGVPAALDNNLLGIVPGPRVNPQYLLAWLQTIDMARFANTQSLPSLRGSVVAELKFPLPDLETQTLAASRVERATSAADRMRDRSAAAIDSLRILRARALAEAFVGPIPLSTIGADRPERSGWHWNVLSYLARLESGHTPSRRHPAWWGGDIPWIQLADIRAVDGRVIHSTLETTNPDGIANSAARILPTGTVVMSRTASVGFVARMGRPMATSQDFVNWVCGPELDSEFLMYLLIRSRDYIRSLSAGAIHKTVYYPTVKDFHVCIPSIDEQRRIVAELRERLAAIEAMERALKVQREAIDALPTALLRRAFAEIEAA